MTEEEKRAKESMEAAYGAAPVLDLSKIKNIKAAEKKNNISKEIVEKAEKQIEKERKSKFSFTEEHEIRIPTNGYLYQNADDEDIKNGIVRLQPMTLKDEEILSNQSYIKNGSVFRRLIDSCMLNNFEAKYFTPYDVYYLIYALREITYGKDYSFEVSCIDEKCNKKFNYDLKMSEVEFETLENEIEPIKTVKLPVSKYTVTIRYQTIGDDEEARKMVSDCGDLAKSFAVRTVEILNNDDEPVNPKDWPEFYEAIPGKDRAELTKLFKDIDDLKVPTVKVTCPKCGAEWETEIPFNKEFFRY
jgi:hypothetical protein